MSDHERQGNKTVPPQFVGGIADRDGGWGTDDAGMLRGRFDRARSAAGIPKSAFQLRDLRAKAGTDKAESSGDIVQARDQLGHTTVTMTEHYVRNRKGKKITPTK